MRKQQKTCRALLATLTAGLLLTGCTTFGNGLPSLTGGSLFNRQESTSFSYPQIYAAKTDGGYNIPAVPWEKINPSYLRQNVNYPTSEAPGTIVVDTGTRHLYLVEQNGKAVRYGIGIGAAGFSWSGRAVVDHKQQWPRWFPPAEMIGRKPELQRFSAENGGMGPGLRNPLGARALYIYQGGKDTLYRIHGNPEWWSIGRAVSSGCIRMLNQDAIDLYNRVSVNAPIVVK